MILQIPHKRQEERRLINVAKVSLMQARLNLQQAELWKEWHEGYSSRKLEWGTMYEVLLCQAMCCKARAKAALVKYERIQGTNVTLGLATRPLSKWLGSDFRGWDAHRLAFGLYDSPSSGDTW